MLVQLDTAGTHFNGSSYIPLILLDVVFPNFINDRCVCVHVEYCSVILFSHVFIRSYFWVRRIVFLLLLSYQWVEISSLPLFSEDFVLNCYYFSHKLFSRFFQESHLAGVLLQSVLRTFALSIRVLRGATQVS